MREESILDVREKLEGEVKDRVMISHQWVRDWKHNNGKLGRGEEKWHRPPGSCKCRSKIYEGIKNWRDRQQIWKVSIYKPKEKPWYDRFYKLLSNETNTFIEKFIQIL